MGPFDNFRCDNCGACCQKLIVEATHLDAKREPRLYEIFTGDREKLRIGAHVISLYDLDKKQCPFLDERCHCSIYPTRPNECVDVEPGDAKCQQARNMAGLPLLKDTNGKEPSIEVLADSCEHYNLVMEELGIE